MSGIPTTAAAELILRLYDLRREEVMRRARRWVVFEFQPKTAEDLLKVARGFGSEENAYLRQVLSYWEMAHSFVNRGAVDPDLFLDSQGEGLFIYTKFLPFAETIRQTSGAPFMPQTAKMVDTLQAAKERVEAIQRMMAARAAQQ